MIKIELEINNVEFQLNEIEDLSKLKRAKFKKVGFFYRHLFNPKKGEKIYFSKNCSISLFKSFGKKFDPYSKELDYFLFGPSTIGQGYTYSWGTSAFFYFFDNKLYKFSFQTIKSRVMAKKVIYEFEKRIVSVYGNPICTQQNENRICSWTDENSKIITELNESIQHSFIHWIAK